MALKIKKELLSRSLRALKMKLITLRDLLRLADNDNYTNIGIWMDRESEIERMMLGECPYCDNDNDKSLQLKAW